MLVIISLIFVSLALLAVLLYLAHQRYTLRQLTQQIESKRQTQSHGRLRLSQQSRALVELTLAVEAVFQDQEVERITHYQERQDLDQAISNIAHDIRTPLTVASGYTQQALAQVKAGDLPDPANLVKIRQHLHQVSNRLESLLDYRRVLEREVRPVFAPVDVAQLVLTTALGYYEAFQAAGLAVDLDLASEHLWTQTDAALLERVLQNLLGNLLKHGEGSGHIVLRQEGGQVWLTITNQIAQPIQQVQHLTKRFYSENLSEVESSSGLGLYISEQLVQLLGGRLALASEGLDFRVTVSLPMAATGR